MDGQCQEESEGITTRTGEKVAGATNLATPVMYSSKGKETVLG